MEKSNKTTFLVTYVSVSDLLTWTARVEAYSVKEAHDIVAKKGKVTSVKKEE